MVRRYSAAVILVLALAVAAVRADDFWVKKEWKQWSKDECVKMLHDSPWTKKVSIQKSNNGAALPSARSNIGAANSTTGSLGSDATGTAGSVAGSAGESTEDINYYVSLRSALPVRQAMVRWQQIQRHYEKMSADEKKALDAQMAQTLDRSFDQIILIHIDYESNIQSFSRVLAAYWQNLPEDAPPVDFYLINEHGEHVMPVKFVVSRGAVYSIDVAFPRMVNNEPVVRQGDKVIRLQFTSPAVSDLPEQLQSAEFRLDKMAWNGKTVF